MEGKIWLFFTAIMTANIALAQHAVTIRNLWMRPQVHVIFGEYNISFTIRDINKALRLLQETGDKFTTASCGLDSSKDYYYELFPGSHAEYHDTMQPILQNKIGVFLLSAGRAVVERRHKALQEIIMDMGILGEGEPTIFVSFFDPKTKTMLFSGQMPVAMYHNDLGIDD